MNGKTLIKCGIMYQANMHNPVGTSSYTIIFRLERIVFSKVTLILSVIGIII